MTVAASVATASEAGPANGAVTITRSGDLSAPLTVSYTVSGTATAGSDYVALPGVVTLDPGAASAVIPIVPIDDTLVESNETVVVTLASSTSYLPGSGPATVTIISNDQPADLVVTSVTGPSTAGAGTAITLNDITKNQGGGPSQPSTTGFYLSKDLTVDVNDINLGTRPVPQLAAGASDTAASSFTIPSTAATGT